MRGLVILPVDPLGGHRVPNCTTLACLHLQAVFELARSSVENTVHGCL